MEALQRAVRDQLCGGLLHHQELSPSEWGEIEGLEDQAALAF